MFWSRFYLPTLKEAPSDAEVASHKLMIRAGMIRKLTSGVYNYLPYGLIAINKVSSIVREEMNRAGAIEVLLPTVQPADLWRESGRWEFYGKELLRFKDRHERDFCLGPTHEEVITDLVRGEVRSYRQLPLNLYQIQSKFRDEIRPRFGLMRGREFIMKDAYSFDCDDAGAELSYRSMYETYVRIFKRLGLRFKAVEADSGAIGGNFSHEFMVLASTGEDSIAACTACDYAANIDRAVVRFSAETAAEAPSAMTEVATPGRHSVEEVAAFMGAQRHEILKTLLLTVDGKIIAVLLRGDRELNLVKVKNYFKAVEVDFATPKQVEAVTGAPVGFAGPAGLKLGDVIADNELKERSAWISGANKADTHFKNLCLERDAKVTAYADLRSIAAGDPCPRCGAQIELPRGIEVGHVFKLGTKYSAPLKAMYLDEEGRERVMLMGCYGIGITRIVAAAVEQNHDDNGLIFPPPLAPFSVNIINLDPKSDTVGTKAREFYNFIKSLDPDVLMDDRDERPGVKFKDADLIGTPMQLVLGAKGLARGVVEAKDRRSGEKIELPSDNFEAVFKEWRQKVYVGWGLQ